MTIDEQMIVLGLHKSKVPLELSVNGQAGWFTVSESHQFNFDNHVYRRKPQVPREMWINEYSAGGFGNPHRTKEDADKHADDLRTGCIHYREVLDQP